MGHSGSWVASPAARALDLAETAFRDLDDEQLAGRIDLCGWIGLAAIGLERIDDLPPLGDAPEIARFAVGATPDAGTAP